MRESIRGYTDAYLEQLAAAGRLGPVAAELQAARELVVSSEDLRRVLSDPGIPAPSRRAVLADLLASRVSGETLRLLLYPVEVDRATEFVADVAWLATRVQAAAGQRHPVSEVVLGRLAAAERLDGYAAAVLEPLAGDHVLDDIEDELFRFMRVVDGTEALRDALTSRDLPAETRRSVVVDLLGTKATPATVRLASYATQVGRPRDYIEQLERLVERVAAESNRRLAEVVSAVDLDDDQQRRLAAALSRLLGRTTEVRVTVDPSILGGFVATIGETVVDGSVRTRLDRLKERLTLPEATITTTGEPS